MIKIIANSDKERVWIDTLEVGEEGYNVAEAAAIVAAMHGLCNQNEEFDVLVRAIKEIAKENVEEYK